MAKRSQRRLARSDKDQLGCMWGFISLFDFRQGRFTRRLLSDRRRGSSRYITGDGFSRSGRNMLTDFDEHYQSGDDCDECGGKQNVDNCKRSVKKLMAEEMFGEQDHLSTAVEQIKSDSTFREKLGKNRKQLNKKSKVARDVHDSASTSLESQESCRQSLVEQSSRNLDLAAVMEEFCSHIRQCQQTDQHNENLSDSSDAQKMNCSVKGNQLNELDVELIQKKSCLHEKLSEATEAFLSQKYIDAKQLACDGKIKQSEQFMDALDILSSNKELFLKLLQDRSSLSLKHMQDIRDDQQKEVRHEALDCSTHLQKKSMHNLFRRKAKSEGGNPNQSKESDCPQAANRIVVLKPSPVSMQTCSASTSPSSLQSQYSSNNQGQGKRVGSHFSFTEIKRKLKAIKENKNEQHLVSMNGLLHRTPEHEGSRNGDKGTHEDTARKDVPRKSYCHVERIVKSSNSDKRAEKIGKSTTRIGAKSGLASTSSNTSENSLTTRAVLRQREYSIYEEAKKHLSEMLSTEGEEGVPSKEFPRTLGRILALPDYNFSPLYSPGRDKERVSAKKMSPTHVSLQIDSDIKGRLVQENNASSPTALKQKLEAPLCPVGSSPDIDVQDLESDADTQGHLSDMKSGEERTIEMVDITSVGRSSHISEPILSTPNMENDQATADNTTNCEGERPMGNSRLHSPEGNIIESTSEDSCPLLIQKIKALDEGPERPSPVSVLEPYFLDDISSPPRITRPAELQVRPLQIRFEDNDSSTIVVARTDPEIHLRTCTEDKKPTFEYIQAVLQASGLSWDEYFEKSHFTDHLIDPSLLEEVEVLPDQLCSDQKLLFDCINEALTEIYVRHFGCSPWVSFVKPDTRPVPEGKHIIFEAWERIRWHLEPYLPPRSLDQIVRKDLAKGGTWMDLRFDTDAIGVEMGDIMLAELMEDTIQELCN